MLLKFQLSSVIINILYLGFYVGSVDLNSCVFIPVRLQFIIFKISQSLNKGPASTGCNFKFSIYMFLNVGVITFFLYYSIIHVCTGNVCMYVHVCMYACDASICEKYNFLHILFAYSKKGRLYFNIVFVVTRFGIQGDIFYIQKYLSDINVGLQGNIDI